MEQEKKKKKIYFTPQRTNITSESEVDQLSEKESCWTLEMKKISNVSTTG